MVGYFIITHKVKRVVYKYFPENGR